MNIQHFFNDRTEIRTYRALTKAPLAPWIEQYAEHLRQEGYSMESSCEHLRMLGRFNEWLDRQSYTIDIVTPDAFEGFRDHLQGQGKLRNGYDRVLRHLFRIMHPDLCVETPSHLDVLLSGFRDYQLNERGLARTSVVDSRRLVQNFLEQQVPGGVSGDLSQIQPDLIADWIKRQANRASAAYARHIVTALRSFFSYAFYKGLIDRNLATCVPSVRSWSLADLPRHLSAQQVQKVLDSCDRNRPGGKRDFAILLLCARLGLRAGEVIALQLDDIDWDDEVRVFLEERTSFSPDGLTGMEANLRFVGPETMESKIFSRLTAWQNWIFQRPNAVGEDGALRRYGTGQKAQFDMTRV